MGITQYCFGLSYLTAFGCGNGPAPGAARFPWTRFGRHLCSPWPGCGRIPSFWPPSPADARRARMGRCCCWPGCSRSFISTAFCIAIRIRGRSLFCHWCSDSVGHVVRIHPLRQHDGSWFTGESFWGMFHGVLLLLASVGITRRFPRQQSMYLVQVWRLLLPPSPLGGVRLLSLERLERMNRRAVNFWRSCCSRSACSFEARCCGENEVGQRSENHQHVGLWLVELCSGCSCDTRLICLAAIWPMRPAPRLMVLMLAGLLGAHPFAPGDSR